MRWPFPDHDLQGEAEMKYHDFYFPSSSGLTQIHVNVWLPEDRPIRGVVQIAHGVAEYGMRYAPFAAFLCDQGYAVLAGDHLGHGQSTIPGKPMVYLGEEDGWRCVVEDLEKLRQMICAQYPHLPVCLFGHSMGSFLTRTHMILYPGLYDGYILCGTGYPSAVSLHFGRWLSGWMAHRRGKAAYSSLLEKLAFGRYNQRFAPNRTTFDWGSRNEENVDAYLADPLCGQPSTIGLFHDLFGGLLYITKGENIAQMSKERPVLLISGSDDPVGDMGRGVHKTCQAFRNAGVRDVRMKLYPGLRHEILNERENQTIFGHVASWLETHMLTGREST